MILYCNGCDTEAEWPLPVVGGQTTTLTIYIKQNQTTSPMPPVVEIFTKAAQRTATPATLVTADQLAYQQINNIVNPTNWQTITLTYTPSHNEPLFYRVRANDGNASGTGSSYVDFYESISVGSGGSTSVNRGILTGGRM